MIRALWSYWPWMLLISSLQIRSLLKKGQKKEALVYGGLMALALVGGTLLIAKIQVPTPTLLLRKLFEPLGEKLMG